MEIIFQNALQFYKNGRLDEAEKLFKQILEIDPSHLESLYFLGVIAMDKGIFDIALDYLDKAHLLAPQNQDYTFSLAVALQETGHLNEALSYFKTIDNLPETQNCIGNIYRSLGDNQKALSAFNSALEKNPQFIWAIVNKAMLLNEIGSAKEAYELLEKATQIDPFFATAWHQLALLQLQMNDIDKALFSIEKALKLNPNASVYWNDYGRILAIKSKDEEALVALDKAILLNRFSYEAYYNKALILEKINHLDEAELSYRDAIRCNHNFANAYNNLGSLLYRMGRLNEALETYRQVFIINPKHMEACFNLAVILEDLEEYEEAAGLYFNVLSQNAYPEQVHIRLAAMLPKWFTKDKSSEKEALRYAQGWLKHFPDNPLAQHTLNAFTHKINDDISFSYTQTFYNAFADSYDEKMKELSCHVPNLIKSVLPNKNNLVTLDLGCGTGACSFYLKPISKKLIGVDISRQMLEKAKATKNYDTLEQKDILDYIIHTKIKFDLIICADVFCYMSNLTKIFQTVHTILKKNGSFIFTIEANDTNENYRITPFGRYLHKKDYIEKLLSMYHYSWTIQNVNLRKEGTSFAKGFLIIAHKHSY